jgi:hypothetical protein
MVYQVHYGMTGSPPVPGRRSRAAVIGHGHHTLKCHL